MSESYQPNAAAKNRLSIDIAQLSLADPFMIASSHWTDSHKSFFAIARLDPSAVTLKTISLKDGGGATSGRRRVDLNYPLHGSRGTLGAFTDGPKKQELLNAVSHKILLNDAFKTFDLVKTKIGVSVRAGEDYKKVKASLEVDKIAYVELNWKYTFRNLSGDLIAASIHAATQDVSNFFDVFRPLPCIVKLSHEMLPFLSFGFTKPLIEEIANQGGILLVANTMRSSLPLSRYKHQGKGDIEGKGVVFGEPLFLHTFNALMVLKELKADKNWKLPRLIATGGITDIGAVVDVLAAGADAVQLCRALDSYGPRHLTTLRNQLRFLVKKAEEKFGETILFPRFVEKLQNDSSFWFWAAHESRQIESSPEEVGARVSQPQTQKDLFGIYREVISLETNLNSEKFPLLNEPLPTLKAEFEIESHTFALNRAVLSAYAIGKLVDERLRFQQMAMENAADFRHLVREGTYTYAIVPQSLLDETLESKDGTAPNAPLALGQVGYSCVELVGLKDKLPQNVYYFKGVTANAALAKLEGEDPNPKRSFDAIETQDLAPILKYWYKLDAILGRAPLTRVFPLLGPKEMHSNWAVLRDLSEPLVLVVNKKMRSFHTGDVNEQRNTWVYANVLRLVAEIHADPERSARSLVTAGYSNHIANFLGARVLA